jgi:hypothetical protein
MAATRLLAIGAGFLQSFLLRRAEEMGLDVIAIAGDPRGHVVAERSDAAEAARTAEAAIAEIEVKVER